MVWGPPSLATQPSLTRRAARPQTLNVTLCSDGAYETDREPSCVGSTSVALDAAQGRVEQRLTGAAGVEVYITFNYQVLPWLEEDA